MASARTHLVNTASAMQQQDFSEASRHTTRALRSLITLHRRKGMGQVYAVTSGVPDHTLRRVIARMTAELARLDWEP